MIENKTIQGKLQDYRDLLAALDAMPVKKLAFGKIRRAGIPCALGCLAESRGVDLGSLRDITGEEVARMCGVDEITADAIQITNDCPEGARRNRESQEARWSRMRAWAAEIVAEYERLVRKEEAQG